jgi:hypothetical protein
VIKLPADAKKLLYSKFNIRYCLGGKEMYNPVKYAAFNKRYLHVAIDGIDYSGDRETLSQEPGENSVSGTKTCRL